MNFETIRVRVEGAVCYLKLDRPEANNSINQAMVEECRQALQTNANSDAISIVVLEGLPQVFCMGADFHGYADGSGAHAVDTEALYDLWNQLASGPFVSIAHVRGRANAGGVGFAAACDIVLADRSAEFSLSELLFSLFPACVLPFLSRRIGFQKAHYMTLTTKPIAVQQASEWGLIDACDDDSEDLLRKHLLRLRLLSKVGIGRYKAYVNAVNPVLTQSKATAIAANRELFSNKENLDTIRRFVRTGRFPWED